VILSKTASFSMVLALDFNSAHFRFAYALISSAKALALASAIALPWFSTALQFPSNSTNLVFASSAFD